jgi:hypothetical protein
MIDKRKQAKLQNLPVGKAIVKTVGFNYGTPVSIPFFRERTPSQDIIKRSKQNYGVKATPYFGDRESRNSYQNILITVPLLLTGHVRMLPRAVRKRTGQGGHGMTSRRSMTSQRRWRSYSELTPCFPKAKY